MIWSTYALWKDYFHPALKYFSYSMGPPLPLSLSFVTHSSISPLTNLNHTVIVSPLAPMFYIRSLDLIYLIAKCLYPIANISLFTHSNPLAPGNQFSILYFYEFYFYFQDSIYKWNHAVFVLLCLVSEKAMAPHSSTFAWKIPWMVHLAFKKMITDFSIKW